MQQQVLFGTHQCEHDGRGCGRELVPPRDFENGAIGTRECLEADPTPAGRILYRSIARGPRLGEFIEDRLYGGL